MTDIQRIKKVVNWLIFLGYAESEKEIADKLGYTKSSFSQIINGKVPVSEKFVRKLCSTNENINFDWIFAGNGEMLLSNDSYKPDVKPISDFNFMHIPMITVSAQAGYLRGYGDLEYIEELPTMPVIVDRDYKGKYRVFEVDGDSMDDGSRNAICDKDKVLCREVKRDLWKSKLHIRDWNFVIIHKSAGITIKRIIKHETETGLILCHPTNSIFEDFALNLNDIIELYSVVKIIDRSARL